MDYKYATIDSLYIIIIEDREFLTSVGYRFKKHFIDKHSDAKEDNVFIGYEEEEVGFLFDTKNSLINADEIKNIPESEWKYDSWP